MKYLFLCSIGPVQDFIASARRSRDLWYGSWMLSELSKSAARALAIKYGVEHLIFPAPDKMEWLEDVETSVSNKVVALVSDPPQEVGKWVEKEIQNRLQELQEDAFSHVQGEYNHDLAVRQMEDLLEFYWVGVELPEQGDYPEIREKAEALMAARKNTRDFQQFAGENTYKSSLDGARESVIPDEAYPKAWEAESKKVQKTKNLYKRYRARRGERLSGVDLLKRLGGEELEPTFRSTSHVSALPFLQMIEGKGENQNKEMLQEIAVMIKEAGGEVTRLDGSLLYSNRITEWVGESEQQEDLLRQLEDILTKYAGKQRPNPYYALLMADGDNMGKTIDHQKEIKAHQDLSFVLSEFSERVSQIVKQNKGVPMYVGGDDILAYLPLHSVLDCAGQLEKEFQKRLSRYHFEGNGEKRSPTLSAGIVVAHHLTPLSSVLELVREAEKAAKAVEGKNALVVTLSKRGGYPRTISGKWGSISGRLFQLIAFHLQKSISKGTAYELRDLHRTLSPSSVGKKAIAQEALRIIKRKQEEGGEKAVSEKVISQFHEWIMDDEVSVGNLAREMVVAQEFAGIYGIEQAEMISEFIEE